MSLRYALLSLLLDCDATGYDLAKQFDASVANFWHALPQQLYQELSRMEDDGLVSGEEVVQAARPNKRVFSVTDAGRAALSDWIDEPADLRSMKDELLVKIYGADLKAPDEIAAILAASVAPHAEKLASYEAVAKFLLGAQSESEYLRTTRRVGPYLTLKRGMMYERENIAWAEWAMAAMAARVSRSRPTSVGALRSPRRRSAEAEPGD
jgi:DNA-binding PadR family transcriptional regulator